MATVSEEGQEGWEMQGVCANAGLCAGPCALQGHNCRAGVSTPLQVIDFWAL